MAVPVEEVVEAGNLSDETAELARQVRTGVVAVRGSRSSGAAGVVWDERGLVVTNYHVVPGDWAEVILPRDIRVPARVIRRAPRLDLVALLLDGPVPRDALVPVRAADARLLRSGELVLAVGHPLGECNAVTLGVVSGLGRLWGVPGQPEVIRAAITLRPGNSGGALADIHGRVVGITHMVIGRGLGLAVPSHVVQRFLLD